MKVSVRFVGSGDSFGSGGRFQTCILVDGDGTRFAIDFGTSSLIALNQQGIEHNSIDAILLTHLHGDHCGGVPFMLVDAMLGARRRAVGNLRVTPYAAKHTRQTNPTFLRVEVGDKVIAYTGDGEWTDEMAKMGRGADLVVAECYYYEKPVKWHLNYPALVEHLRDFGAKRVILTHMSREMLLHAEDVPEESAHDGMVVEV